MPDNFPTFASCCRNIILLIIGVVALSACEPMGPNANTYSSELSESVEMDASDAPLFNYLDTFYVPVYSDIYSETKDMRFLLTATLSIRNTSFTDTLVVNDVEYYDTRGNLVRHYIDHPIYLIPMATVEYVIEQDDKSGGSGANFIVILSSKNRHFNPLVQSVMISISGQQGVAFSCNGVSIKQARQE